MQMEACTAEGQGEKSVLRDPGSESRIGTEKEEENVRRQ